MQLEKTAAAPETFEKKDHPITLVFIEANEDRLCAVQREPGARIPWERIFRTGKFVHERALMEPIRKLADVVIETHAIQRA